MTAYLLIFGFVQGVGYRQFVKKTAINYNLTGWVTNLPDGRVEVLFSGSKKEIEEAIELLKKGPFLSQIKHIETEWRENGEKYEDFKILREL